MSEEPLTPVEVENRLRNLITQLTEAQNDLRQKRDAETKAEIAYRKAKLVAAHSPDCPRVTRGGPTVADRESWIDQQTHEKWADYRSAVTLREAAQDNLRTVRDIAEVVRSLSASVRTAFQMAGTS